MNFITQFKSFLINNKNIRYDYLIIIAIGLLFFVPLLGKVNLFDWDEINFAECAREMILSKDYLRVQIDFQPFWEKPPLFFWLQSLSMHLWGINEYAARFPNAIVGILTLVFIFHIGNKMLGRAFAWLWVLCYFGSILPHLYCKSGIIDPIFNLFIFSSLYHIIQYYWHQKNSNIFYAGILIGLAILTKGPVAFLIICIVLAIYWALQRLRLFIHPFAFIAYSIIALLVTSLWFGIDILKNGTWFTETFIKYQIRLFSTEDSGHGGFVGYHFVVLLLGCFPASIFAVVRLLKKNPIQNKLQKNFSFNSDFEIWAKILFWVVLILFSIVQSKIVHYSSLCYLPLTYLAARQLLDICQRKENWSKFINIGLAIIGGIFAIATISLPWVGKRIDLIKPLASKDPFAMENMNAVVSWSGTESLAGILLVLVLVLVFLIKNNVLQKIAILFVGTALFVQLTLIYDINNIETYSQRAAIDFYKEKSKEDCYINTYKFKSFAHLFYGNKQSNANPKSHDNFWLLEGNIDKDVYFVCKIQNAIELNIHPNLKEIGRKNGFVFFKRSRTTTEN